MNRTLLLIATCSLATISFGQAVQQRIVYQWLNQPCGDILNCNAGCSACNLPANSSSTFFGTNVAWLGVEICPLPVSVGDNAVFSAGWPAIPDNNHRALLSGITTQAMRIDSVIIRHAIYSTGPQRVKVMFTTDPAAAFDEVADVAVPVDFGDIVLTDLGIVPVNPASNMGGFQLAMIPYQGNGGGWAVDEIRIVGTPAIASTVGIAEMIDRPMNTNGPWYDVMGRPMSKEPAPGIYIGPGGKRVHVL